MKIKSNLLLIFSVFCSFLFADVTIDENTPAAGRTFSGAGLGTVTITNGSNAQLIINVPGASSMTNLIIRGSNIRLNIANASSFTVTGRTDIMGTNNADSIVICGSGTAIFSGLTLNGPAYIRNAMIYNATNAINTNSNLSTVILEGVHLRGRTSAFIGTAALTARFTSFISDLPGISNQPLRLSGTNSAIAEFCYFQKNVGTTQHIYSTRSSLSLEGSNFDSTPVITGGGAYDLEPQASSGYPTYGQSTDTLPLNVRGGAGYLTFSATTGIGSDKIIPPGLRLNIGTGGLTIPAGTTLRIGYSEIPGIGWAGGSSVYTNANQSLTIQGNLVSSGNATNYLRAGSGNWGGLILSGGSTEVYNTSFIDATKSVQDKANGTRIERSSFSGTGAGPFVEIDHIGTSTYRGNTFSAIGSYNTDGSMVILAGNHIINGNTFSGTSPAALRVNLNTTPANEISGNTISFANGYGIRVENTSSPKFTNNTIIGTGDAIQITNGTPSFSGNTISGGNLNISGTAGKNLSFQNNIFSAGAKVAANADATAGTYYDLTNNNWNQIPAIANYSGTSEIRYEPWTGNGTKQAPMAITGVVPANNATTINPVTALTFTVDDIGYHNGTPLQYRLYITGPAGYTAYADTVQPTFHGRGSSVTFTIPALNVPREPGDYYWSVSVNNRISDDGNWGGSPVYKFTITRPNVLLNLSRPASAAQASAGEQVDYTVTFTNAETGTDMRNVVISTILPEEVYWNGVLNFSGAAAMGNISVRAFSTINRSDSDFVTLNAGTNPTNITGIVPAADNTKVRRLDVVITNLPRSPQSGYTGSFVYQTIVK